MRTNDMKRRLEQDALVLCMAVNQGRGNDVAMIAAACGFHALFVDMEHSAFSIETVSQICTAAAALGVTPLVRASSKTNADIATLLDVGAMGLMVPHIDSAAEARSVVARCKFPPVGNRSVSTVGPHLGYGSFADSDIIRHMNRETVLIAMLETPEAVAQADEIAAVDGIDAIHIGARDLCAELGTPGDYRSSRMVALFEQATAAARRHGKAMGVGGVRGDTAFQLQLYRMGVRYLTIGSDAGYMLAGGKADVAAISSAVAAS